jgi:hypothetical protein
MLGESIFIETMSTPLFLRAATTLFEMFSSARNFRVMGIPSLL